MYKNLLIINGSAQACHVMPRVWALGTQSPADDGRTKTKKVKKIVLSTLSALLSFFSLFSLFLVYLELCNNWI